MSYCHVINIVRRQCSSATRQYHSIQTVLSCNRALSRSRKPLRLAYDSLRLASRSFYGGGVSYGGLRRIIYSVSQKNYPPPLWIFFWRFPKRFGVFSPNFTRLLHVPIYTGIKNFFFNYLQLWRSYAILSAATIMLKTSTIGWNERWVVALNMA